MPSPSATPIVRLAPEGILYVVEGFSVTTQSGIHGFPAGKQVQVVSREGNRVIITDDGIETSQPASKFTNDLDIAERIARERNHRTAQASQVAAPLGTSAPDELETPSETLSEQERKIAALEKQRSSVDYSLKKLTLEMKQNFPGESENENGERVGIRAPDNMKQSLRALEYKLQAIELELETLRN
jgi:hypothetical protein